MEILQLIFILSLFSGSLIKLAFKFISIVYFSSLSLVRTLLLVLGFDDCLSLSLLVYSSSKKVAIFFLSMSIEDLILFNILFVNIFFFSLIMGSVFKFSIIFLLYSYFYNFLQLIFYLTFLILFLFLAIWSLIRSKLFFFLCIGVKVVPWLKDELLLIFIDKVPDIFMSFFLY